MSWHSTPLNMTSFGKGVFANIIKNFKMIKEVLNVLLSTFIRREETEKIMYRKATYRGWRHA